MKYPLILFLAVLLCPSLYAQQYALPDTLDITDSYRVTGFAPIGWSRDGKVAFVTYDEVDGRGGTIIGIHIFDCVDDTEAWYSEYDTFEIWIAEEDGVELPTFEEYFASSGVQNALRDYSIETNPGAFSAFPYSNPSLGYAFDGAVQIQFSDTVMDILEITVAVENWELIIGRINLAGSSGRSGQKTITSKNYDPPANWLYAVSAVGCLKSPFEERVLVIYSTLEADFEEPQTYYHFSGAHLEYGYNDPFDESLFSGDAYK